jgi:hypothetical protein
VTEVLHAVRALWSRRHGRWIAAYLVVQLAVPAAYYVRRDPHDERFSWRMFSTMRMVRCEPELRVNGHPVMLSAQFHEAWIELARRGRFGVIETMAQHLCHRHPGDQVIPSLRCTYLDGRARSYGGFDACKVPEL